MNLKILFRKNYTISAIMEGDKCLIENQEIVSDANYHSNYVALVELLSRIADIGLQNLSSKQSHLICNKPKIFELIRGDLRLVYFHGHKNTVVVCTDIVVKKSQKTDKKIVNKAKCHYNDYFDAVELNTINEVEE